MFGFKKKDQANDVVKAVNRSNEYAKKARSNMAELDNLTARFLTMNQNQITKERIRV